MTFLTGISRSSFVRYSAALVIAAAVLLLIWPGLFTNLFALGFGVERFMPHGHCYLWVPSLVALHLSSDILIGISYTAISFTLAYLVHRARRDMPFHWIFLAFGLFIVACGATHFMEVWTLWNATYWLSGYVKLITAAASLATAVVLPAVVPKALLLVREAKVSKARKQKLETINQDLEKEILERKATEERLHQTTQTLHAIFTAAPHAIYAADAGGKILMWNPAAQRIFGWKETEALGRSLPLVPPAKLDEFDQVRKRVQQGQSFADMEVQRQRKDGSILDVGLSIAPLRNADEEIVGDIGIIADITDRKRAEESMRASEEKYKAIFDYATMGIYQSAPDGTLVNCNATLARLLGYESPEQLIGLRMSEDVYYSKEDREDLIRAYESPGSAIDIEVLWRKRNGEPIWVHLNSHAVKDAQGKTLYFDGFVYDITERKTAEADLQTERRVIEALFEQLPVGVILQDVGGSYTRANRAICQMFDLSEKDIVGMRPADLNDLLKAENSSGESLRPEEFPSSVSSRTRRATEAIELSVTTAARKKRRISIAAAPLMNAPGELFGTVIVVTDVTERQVLEEQLRQSQKMESIGTLAGGIAHDFNNLLTVIQGYTQLAISGAGKDSKVAARLAEVEKATNRATSLTRQLLAFSRRQRLERKAVDLNAVVNDISKMIQRIIGEDIDVRIQQSASLLPAFADAAQIEQVIMNLAINARDAMPQGGELVIETKNVTVEASYQREHPYSKPGDYVQLIVSDTGSGMDAETKQRIFEPFFTTKEVGRGTGLGMSMAYGIIKQHEGLIEVYSELGQGTSVKIYLPVHKESIVEEQPKAPQALRGGSETIIVAEDEEALRGLARTILEELGYTVLLASDGAEAVELYQANQSTVSLLVLDIVMPRMGGREAYERILEMGSLVPVLFMTGYSIEIVENQIAAQNKFLERTSSYLIQKPYSFESFGRKVREVLDERKNQ